MHVDQTMQRRGPFIVVDSDGCAAFSTRDGIDVADVPLVVVNVSRALANFKRLVGDRDRFAAHQMQQVTGCSYRQILKWAKAGVIPPCETLTNGSMFWDLEGAFIAGLIGGLRRAGQPLAVLQAVAELCREPEPVEA